MSESVANDIVDTEPKLENHSRKRVRHRKKLLYEKILKQMEFYFSDANLSKDRFLGELVKSDPFVTLEIFLKFNKIRSLTQDVNDISKAMKHSRFLELSEDKLKVRRTAPVEPYDADARTIYVESIPVTASRDWLERVFSDFGNVAYISLPKFKNSQRIKGYGFIEFDKPEDAQNCITAFTKMGCKLPTFMAPDELSSIKTFSMEDIPEETNENQPKEVLPKEENQQKDEYEPPKKKTRKSKEKKLVKSLELKLDENEYSVKKLETPSDENKSIVPSEDVQTTDAESKGEVTSQDERKDKNEKDTPRKKARKKTAKERTKAKQNGAAIEAPKGALWGLQVLSKSEWKSLRNKYLNLQRKNMKEIKFNLKNKRHAYSSIPEPAAPTEELEPAMNPQTEERKSIVPLERIPGVFVKEELPELCLDVRLTKRTVRSNVHVLHVDAKEGQSQIVIRFDSASAAGEYCSNSSNNACVLSGAEEDSQWALAEAARSARRPRGRARLLAHQNASDNPTAVAPASPQPTHTHIRFDD